MKKINKLFLLVTPTTIVAPLISLSCDNKKDAPTEPKENMKDNSNEITNSPSNNSDSHTKDETKDIDTKKQDTSDQEQSKSTTTPKDTPLVSESNSSANYPESSNSESTNSATGSNVNPKKDTNDSEPTKDKPTDDPKSESNPNKKDEKTKKPAKIPNDKPSNVITSTENTPEPPKSTESSETNEKKYKAPELFEYSQNQNLIILESGADKNKIKQQLDDRIKSKQGSIYINDGQLAIGTKSKDKISGLKTAFSKTNTHGGKNKVNIGFNNFKNRQQGIKVETEDNINYTFKWVLALDGQDEKGKTVFDKKVFTQTINLG
ncbi:hypothetical protein [Mycoplasma tauri]|uniref:hypothetical protein n=1 Tax=Mycoplasma tauri TaxID=547987 RepID=UPI001CC19CDF|nr:hypothetical protein [Mycoplasma tauri]MBZ4203449.1 hypothetical protein [Mycoplasma tauri]